MIRLSNTSAILSQDLNVIGAALRIIVAGGDKLDERGMKRASGASRYLWENKSREILALVQSLSAE